jgi:hypothetical protein
MSKIKITAMIVAGALALVAFGGALAYNKVAAQSPTPTVAPDMPGAPAQPNTGTQPNLQKRMRGGPDNGTQNTDLAAALGITVEKLQSAYQTANAAALKEAVSKGLITQAQADQFTANGLSNSPMREFGRPGSNGVDYNALLANALGITTDQFTAAQQKAEDARIAAAVASGQITQAQADQMKSQTEQMKAREALYADAKFQASIKSAFAASVAQAVTDGVITQAQADAILAEQTDNVFPGGGFGAPDSRGGRGAPFGREGGGPGGPGGPFGDPNGAPQNQQTNPTN